MIPSDGYGLMAKSRLARHSGPYTVEAHMEHLCLRLASLHPVFLVGVSL